MYKGCIKDAPVISKRYTFNQRFTQDWPSVASRTMDDGTMRAVEKGAEVLCLDLRSLPSAIQIKATSI